MTNDVVLEQPGSAPPPEPFVQRHWLFDEIRQWHATDSRALILEGPPGTGKTVMAQQLVSTDHALFPVHAYFSCGATPIPPTAQAVLVALADRLIHKLPGYPEEMFELCRRDGRQEITIEVGSVTAGGQFTAIENLYLPQRRSIEAVLEDLIETPFRTLAARGELPADGVFVVIDGIDGTASSLGEPRLDAPLLSALARIPGLRVVATRRPRQEPYPRPPAHVTIVDLDRAASAGDVREYLSGRLSVNDPARNLHLRELVRVSGRNLLVARYLADNIDLLPLAALETMTGELQGLDQVYDELLRRQVQQSGGGSDEWEARFRAILAIVAQGRDATGMPVALVERTAERLLGVPAGSATVRDIFQACRSFVRVEPGPDGVPAVRPYHPSFRDYLLSPRGGPRSFGRRDTDPVTVDRVIAAQLAERWEQMTAGQPSADASDEDLMSYLFGHFLAHLAAAGGCGPDRSPIRIAGRPRLIYEVAMRHGIPYLLSQLSRLAADARQNQPEMWLLNVAVGLQIRNLIDIPAQELEASFFQQLLAQARVVGASDLARELLAEITLRQLDVLVTAWATGRGDRLPVLHRLDHDGNVVTAVTPLADDIAASAAADGVIRIWDIAGGVRIRTLGDGGYAIRALTVTDRQRLLVAGSDDGTGYAWNPRTGDRLPAHGFGAPIGLLAAIPDSDQVLVGTSVAVSLWNLTNGRSTALSGPPAGGRVVAALAAKDSPLVVVYSGGRIGLFDPVSGDPVTAVDGAGPVHCAALSDCGRYLAAGRPDGAITMRDLHNLHLPPREEEASSRVLVSAIAAGTASRGFPLMVSGDRDGSVTAWNASNGRRVWHHPATERGSAPAGGPAHSGEVTMVSVAGPAGYVLTGGRDGLTNVWDLRTGDRRHHLSCGAPVTAAASSQDGQYAVVGNNQGEVLIGRVWIGDGLAPLTGHDAPVSAALPADAGFVTAAGQSAQAWDASDGRVLQEWAHTAEVLSIVHLGGGEVLTGCADGAARVWSPRSAEPIRILTADASPVTAVASGGRDTVVVGSADGVIRAWRDGFSPLCVIDTRERVEHLLVVPAGTNAVSTHRDRSARVWDLSYGTPVAEFRDFLMTVVALAASADGAWVAMGCRDGTVLVVDVRQGCEVTRIERQWPRLLSCLAFIGNGERLVVGYDDGSSQLWNVATSTWSPERLLHPGAVTAVTPLGARHFLTGSEDGSVGLWLLPGPDRAVELCAHLIVATPVTCLAASAFGDPVLAGTASGDVVCAAFR